MITGKIPPRIIAIRLINLSIKQILGKYIKGSTGKEDDFLIPLLA
jgi:hypothetical protein